jgi:hypothetical protein
MAQGIYLTLLINFIFFSSSCQRKGEDCIYLIPKKFEGNILIIFGQDDGVDSVHEGKNRLYKFDTTGILKTKFKENYGVQRNYFFYVDNVGSRTPIKYAIPTQLKGTNEVVIYNQENGNDFDKNKSAFRYFEMVTVAKEKNIDSIGNLRNNFMLKNLNQ